MNIEKGGKNRVSVLGFILGQYNIYNDKIMYLFS